MLKLNLNNSLYRDCILSLFLFLPILTFIAIGKPVLAASCVVNQTSLEKYQTFEQSFTYTTTSLNNPQDEVSVVAVFTSPSNKKYTVNGFYYDANTFKVRFTPRELGTYTFTTTVNSNLGSQTYESGCTFNVTAVSSSNVYGKKGFITVSPDNPYRIISEADGKNFNGVGINDCWDNHADPSYPSLGPLYGVIGVNSSNKQIVVGNDEYFRTYGDSNFTNSFGEAGSGMNLFRWNPDNCSFGIYSASSAGNSYYTAEGKLGDTLLMNAKKYGFHTLFTIFVGPPYTSLTNPSEVNATKNIIKYAVARFGGYVDMWELLNESGAADPPDAWLQYYRDYIRSVDPYKRLVTNSHPRPNDWNYLDFRSPHADMSDGYSIEKSYTNTFSTNKPVIVGEGYNANGNLLWSPQNASRVRIAGWTSFLAGLQTIYWNTSLTKSTTASSINMYLGGKIPDGVSYDEERDYIRILQKEVEGFDATGMSVIQSNTTDNKILYIMKNQNTVYAYTYTSAGYTTSHTTQFTYTVPFSGNASWIDPKKGTVIQSFSISSGTQTFTTPNFTEDIVLKIVSNQQIPTSAPAPTQPCPQNGDTKRSGVCDSVVNILDFSYLSTKFGTNDPGADLKPDGIVNILDFSVLSSNFNTTHP